MKFGSVIALTSSIALIAACQNEQVPEAETNLDEAPVSAPSPASEPKEAAPLLTNEKVVELIEQLKPVVRAFEADLAGALGDNKSCLEASSNLIAATKDETGLDFHIVSKNPIFDEFTANDWETETFDRFVTSNQNGFPFEEIHRARFYEGEEGETVFEMAIPVGSRDATAQCHGETDTKAKPTPRPHEDNLSGAFIVTKIVEKEAE